MAPLLPVQRHAAARRRQPRPLRRRQCRDVCRRALAADQSEEDRSSSPSASPRSRPAPAGSITVSAGSGFGISTTSKHQDEAWKAIQILTGPDAEQYLASKGRAFAARIATRILVRGGGERRRERRRTASNAALKGAVPYVTTPNWNTVTACSSSTQPLALSGTQSAPTASTRSASSPRSSAGGHGADRRPCPSAMARLDESPFRTPDDRRSAAQDGSVADIGRAPAQPATRVRGRRRRDRSDLGRGCSCSRPPRPAASSWSCRSFASLVLSFTNWQVMGETRFVGLAQLRPALTRRSDLLAGVRRHRVATPSNISSLNIVISLAMAVWIGSLALGPAVVPAGVLPADLHAAGRLARGLAADASRPAASSTGCWPRCGCRCPTSSPIRPMRCRRSSSSRSGRISATTCCCSAPPSNRSRATYLDAAAIDGATAWQRFWRIKLPLISPVAVLRHRADRHHQPAGLRPGLCADPRRPRLRHARRSATRSTRQGFINYRLGYASAIAWMLFAIIMVLTAVQLRLQQQLGALRCLRSRPASRPRGRIGSIVLHVGIVAASPSRSCFRSSG